VELGPKKLEVLHELAPKATVIGLLVNPANPNNEIRSKDMEAAARTLGLKVDVLRASTGREIQDCKVWYRLIGYPCSSALTKGFLSEVYTSMKLSPVWTARYGIDS
jgi:hypothetical protein